MVVELACALCCSFRRDVRGDGKLTLDYNSFVSVMGWWATRV